MTTADFAFCPMHGIVPTKYDFSTGVVIASFILMFFFGIGVFVLMFYVFYVVAIKDRACHVCGGKVYPAPTPIPYIYPPPPPGYYQYPPYYPPYR